MDPSKSESWLGFLEALRPPPGYILDAGIGTTYGLSFDVLTAVLLAFVDADTQGTAPDVAAKLHALSRLRDRLHVLANRTSIHPGSERQPPRLYALYDRVVRDVHLPGASFHPKLWALRFARRDRPELRGSPPFVYRVVCGSRNLSSSQFWEVGARFDGVEATNGEKPSRIAISTAAFVERLIREAPPRSSAARLAAMVAGLRKVRFNVCREMHDDVDLLWGWPSAPRLIAALPKRGRRALIVSPFLRAEFLHVMLVRFERLIIVSSQPELDRLSPAVLRALEDPGLYRKYVVTDSEGETFKLDGLHAKIVICEGEDDRVTFLGSANATGVAWGAMKDPKRNPNCEAVVLMRPGITIDSFLKSFVVDGGRPKPWIAEYVQDQVEDDPDEKVHDELSRHLQQLAGATIELAYHTATRRLELRAPGIANLLQSNAGVSATIDVAPMLLQGRTTAFRPIDDLEAGLHYDDVDVEDVCEFIVLRARAGQVVHTAIVQAHWHGPEGGVGERDAAVRKRLVEGLDPGHLLRLILWGARSRAVGSGGRSRSGGGGRGGSGLVAELPGITLERLLERCVEDETVIDEVETLIATFGGPDAFSPGFRGLWAALRDAWRSVPKREIAR